MALAASTRDGTDEPRALELMPPAVAARAPAAQFNERGELQLDPALPLTTDQLAFVGELSSLGKRVAKNHFWAREEIFLLLENAVSVATVGNDLAKARLTLDRATDIYERALLGRNRIHYVTGT